MDKFDTVFMDNTDYQILKKEAGIIFHPSIFSISPIWENDSNFEYSVIYEVKDYQLYLKSFMVSSDREFPEINGIKPEFCREENNFNTVFYQNIMEPLKFTGVILLGDNIVKEYGDKEELPCYSYKQVRELSFQDGKLIISIDHSRAMLRIRKNIDMGLRNTDKKHDEKCIRKFLKASFIGDYKSDKKIRNKKNKKLPDIKTYFKRIKNL